ncbi:MAG: hypothetical protein ABJF10_26355 [Chthoniobacter sp.]|uniref:hypothetical protein n=1 Tax=Chthoniobacter sp. TaxID=2510640 RepID=UPI0032A422CC
MNRVFAATAFIIATAPAALHAQHFNITYAEKANKQTLPAAAKAIEDNTDIKVALAVDAVSFGHDAEAWGNLYIVANRIVGAVSEVGRDQVGKDAIERDVKKVVIVKIGADDWDFVELKDHTVYVRTNASDKAMTVLQNIIVAALEKALHTGHPPTP